MSCMYPFLSLDFESTGLSINEDRIVQIGLTLALSGTHLLTYEQTINPLHPVSDGARAVHRLDDDTLLSSLTFADVWPNIMHDCDLPVCAWNGWSFDFPLLSAELRRYGLPLPRWRPFDPKLTLRPLPGQGRSLEASCARFGVPLSRPDGRHGAGEDSRALALLVIAAVSAGEMPVPSVVVARQRLQW